MELEKHIADAKPVPAEGIQRNTAHDEVPPMLSGGKGHAAAPLGLAQVLLGYQGDRAGIGLPPVPASGRIAVPFQARTRDGLDLRYTTHAATGAIGNEDGLQRATQLIGAPFGQPGKQREPGHTSGVYSRAPGTTRSRSGLPSRSTTRSVSSPTLRPDNAPM